MWFLIAWVLCGWFFMMAALIYRDGRLFKIDIVLFIIAGCLGPILVVLWVVSTDDEPIWRRKR